jgi:hypothetical protein
MMATRGPTRLVTKPVLKKLGSLRSKDSDSFGQFVHELHFVPPHDYDPGAQED